jgi:hypothetical protein
MLVMLGGRERTAAEWEPLLAGGGFRLDAIHPGPIPVIEARPVPSPPEPT